MSASVLDDNAATRAAILSRIRRAQHRPATPGDDELRAVEDYLNGVRPGPRNLLPDDLVGHFAVMAERMASTVDRVASFAEVPAAVARYVAALGVAPRAVAWPGLDAFAGTPLDWAAAGLAVEARAPVRDVPEPDLVGITGVYAAVAETGTLALLSGAASPASTALLPETHVALVPASRVVGHYEDVFERMRAEGRELPRALNFISGPSRTGDIEQTIVLGAHGPYRVHVVIIEGDGDAAVARA